MNQIGLRLLNTGSWTLRLTFFTIAFVVMYALTRSFCSFSDPFEQTSAVIKVSTLGPKGPRLLQVTRVFNGHEEQSIDSSHTLYAKDNPSSTIQVAGASFESNQGAFTVLTTTVIPDQASGVWCHAAKYRWWPSFSQREFTLTVPDVCFDTGVIPE